MRLFFELRKTQIDKGMQAVENEIGETFCPAYTFIDCEDDRIFLCLEMPTKKNEFVSVDPDDKKLYKFLNKVMDDHHGPMES